MSKNFKRIFALALVMMSLFTALIPAALAETAATGEAVYATTTSKVYFRQNPTSTAKPYVEGCNRIPKGATVQVLGLMGSDYYKVKYGEFEGFVRTKEIGFSNAAATMAQAAYLRVKATSSTREKYRVEGAPAVAAGETVSILSSERGKYYKVSYTKDGVAYEGYLTPSEAKVAVADLTPKLADYTITNDVEVAKGKTLDKVYLRVVPEKSTLLVPKCNSISKKKDITILGQSGDFYYIQYKSYKGFALKTDVKLVGVPIDLTGYEVTKYETAKVGKTTDTVNLRNYPIADSSFNDELEKVKRKRSVNILGESGTFYYIEYDGNLGFGYKADIEVEGVSESAGSGELSTIPATASAELAAKMSAAQAKNGDVVGYVYLPNTNIDYPIYSNRKDSRDARKFYYNEISYNYIFTMADPGARGAACIMGHNMRSSKTMFHQLHHIQNSILGVSKCERCSKSCNIGWAANSEFPILYDGFSKWQLFSMYETPTSSPADVIAYAALNSNIEGTEKSKWIDYQLRRSSVNFGVVPSASDKVIVLITCGDLKGGNTGARLFMCLKAIG